MAETIPQLETQTRAEAETEAAGGLGTLGLNPQLFLAQLLNFSIVLLVMWRWVYRPLVKKMDERSAKIREGLEFSEEAKQAKAEATKEFERVVSEAKTQAHATIREAQEKADALRDERMKQAKAEIEKIALEAKAQIKAERQAAYDALRSDIAELVTAAAAKVAGQMDDKARKIFAAEAIKEVERA